MRRTILAVTLTAVCGAIQVIAQQSHPPNILKEVLGQRAHMRAPLPNTPPTPQLVFDATSIGSPLTLDKGWRVGIKDPRHARRTMAEVFLKDMSLATSGSYEKFFRADGAEVPA